MKKIRLPNRSAKSKFTADSAGARQAKIAERIFINGKIARLETAKISPLDRGFLYGDGVFETFRALDGAILEIDGHLSRLFSSAKKIGISLGKKYSENFFKKGLTALLAENRLKNAIIRLSLTRGTAGWWGMSPDNAKNAPTVVAFAKRFDGYSKSDYRNGIAVKTVSVRRISPSALPSEAKSLNYLNNILALCEALKGKADEALMLNDDGFVAEGARSNIFWVKREKIFTPALSTGILPGITRMRAIFLLKKLGFEVREVRAKRKALNRADEIFITNTSSLAMPVTALDGRKVGTGKICPVCAALLSAFGAFYSDEAKLR